ncbi:MAG TPA: D-glycero-beta-D-manno-heptose 1-phosphate adenylyltransferase [Candidatus Binatia bacterium]|nr:D-glycero-beta-D-manno-heptose 1-phosphate adenylyltransferase [Candidatus Binatia bacterium]
MRSPGRAASYLEKIGSLAAIRRRRLRARRAGRTFVFTNGCFDLLHPGHVRYLAAARAAGDELAVALNADRSVRRLKGPGRPVQTAAARAEVLAALASVDHVLVFDADTPIAEIRALEPDVLVKGADWGEDEIVGSDVVRERGGRVVRVPIVRGQSTTRLVERSRGGAAVEPARKAAVKRSRGAPSRAGSR